MESKKNYEALMILACYFLVVFWCIFVVPSSILIID